MKVKSNNLGKEKEDTHNTTDLKNKENKKHSDINK